MFMSFSIFLLSVVLYTPIHYEQCMFILWKGKKQISTTIKINGIKIHFYILGLISLLLQVKSTTRRKCMLKVISDNTKNVRLYIN